MMNKGSCFECTRVTKKAQLILLKNKRGFPQFAKKMLATYIRDMFEFLHTQKYRSPALRLGIFSCVLLFVGCLLVVHHFVSRPTLVLWVWDGAHDFSFLEQVDPTGKRIEIAYLAAEMTLYDDRVGLAPRQRLLELDQERKLTAVVRVEDVTTSLFRQRSRLEEAVDNITKVCTQKHVARCQIDFDARVSDRDWYVLLLENLREEFLAYPHNIELSVTSLVSWCREPGWLDRLPTNHVVPMFFSYHDQDFAYQIQRNKDDIVLSPKCVPHVGVSLHEPAPPTSYLRTADDIWIFNNGPWNQRTYSTARKLIRH